MSKFLNLISQYNSILNEADQIDPSTVSSPEVGGEATPTPDANVPEAQAQQVSNTTSSEQISVTPENVASVADIISDLINKNRAEFRDPQQLIDLLKTINVSNIEGMDKAVGDFLTQYKINSNVTDESGVISGSGDE
jgi:metallophosphoesterase superfamily enzyme